VTINRTKLANYTIGFVTALVITYNFLIVYHKIGNLIGITLLGILFFLFRHRPQIIKGMIASLASFALFIGLFIIEITIHPVDD